MSLDGRTKRELCAKANALKAYISVGRAGLTEGVISQIDTALDRSSLLKIRVLDKDKAIAKEIAGILQDRLACELVAQTGFVITLYREEQSSEANAPSDDPAES